MGRNVDLSHDACSSHCLTLSARLTCAELVTLNLGGSSLSRLPPSLGCCTRLTELLLGYNDRLTCDGTDLSVLTSLTALKRLELPTTMPDAATTVLAAAAPHIESISCRSW